MEIEGAGILAWKGRRETSACEIAGAEKGEEGGVEAESLERERVGGNLEWKGQECVSVFVCAVCRVKKRGRGLLRGGGLGRKI